MTETEEETEQLLQHPSHSNRSHKKISGYVLCPLIELYIRTDVVKAADSI